MSDQEYLASVAALEERCIADVEKQNWTNKPLTESEKHLIGMAVAWAAHVLKKERDGEQ